MKFSLSLITLILIASPQLWAQARSYQQCSASTTPRTQLDTFCPRMEGIHLEGCCPPLFKKPPLQCKYHIVESAGQAVLVQGSYITCEEIDGVKRNTAKSCCRRIQRKCASDPITLDFLPRLLHRSKSCCFENCPTADYWTKPPAKGGLSPRHELDEGSAACTSAVIDQCEVGDTEDCQTSDFCPVTSEPAPPSTETPTPAPSTPAPSTPTPTPQSPPPPPGTPPPQVG